MFNMLVSIRSVFIYVFPIVTSSYTNEDDLVQLIVNLADLKPISELFIVWDEHLEKLEEVIPL